MKKQRMPPGWTEEQIRQLAEHHDNLTEDEQAAEIEAALTAEGQTVMVVPTELVAVLSARIACRSDEQDPSEMGSDMQCSTADQRDGECLRRNR